MKVLLLNLVVIYGTIGQVHSDDNEASLLRIKRGDVIEPSISDVTSNRRVKRMAEQADRPSKKDEMAWGSRYPPHLAKKSPYKEHLGAADDQKAVVKRYVRSTDNSMKKRLATLEQNLTSKRSADDVKRYIKASSNSLKKRFAMPEQDLTSKRSADDVKRYIKASAISMKKRFTMPKQELTSKRSADDVKRLFERFTIPETDIYAQEKKRSNVESHSSKRYAIPELGMYAKEKKETKDEIKSSRRFIIPEPDIYAKKNIGKNMKESNKRFSIPETDIFARENKDSDKRDGTYYYYGDAFKRDGTYYYYGDSW